MKSQFSFIHLFLKFQNFGFSLNSLGVKYPWHSGFIESIAGWLTSLKISVSTTIGDSAFIDSVATLTSSSVAFLIADFAFLRPSMAAEFLSAFTWNARNNWP